MLWQDGGKFKSYKRMCKQRMNMVENGVAELGFKGQNLKDLLVFITTESDLEELQAFIVNGNHRNILTIISEFRIYMIAKLAITVVDFVKSYLSACDCQQRKSIIDRLTCSDNEQRWVDELHSRYEMGTTTLEAFHNVNSTKPNLHIRRKILESGK